MNRKTIFWSIYLILVGLLLLVKLLFNLHFGWFSAAFAILLLQSGIALIVWGCTNGKKSYRHEGGLHMFMSGTILPDPSDETVTVLFADARVELSAPLPPEMEISSIFANTVVQLPPSWSVRAECSVAFGNLQTPEGSISGFGDRVILVGDGQQCRLRANAVFGQLVLHD